MTRPRAPLRLTGANLCARASVHVRTRLRACACACVLVHARMCMWVCVSLCERAARVDVCDHVAACTCLGTTPPLSWPDFQCQSECLFPAPCGPHVRERNLRTSLRSPRGVARNKPLRWQRPPHIGALQDKPLAHAAARRGHGGSNGMPKAWAKRAASCSETWIFWSNRRSASLMLSGGPRSKRSRGGGRSKSMSDMRVGRENMT